MKLLNEKIDMSLGEMYRKATKLAPRYVQKFPILEWIDMDVVLFNVIKKSINATGS